MSSRRLVVVEEAFAARGGGPHVMPRFTVTEASREAFAIVLVLPDGERRPARAVLETAHIRGPAGSFAMVRVLDLAPEAIPTGTEIWTEG